MDKTPLQPALTNDDVLKEQPTDETLDKQIAEILRDNIYFNGQVGDYIIHGAIQKIKELIQRQSAESSLEPVPLKSHYPEVGMDEPTDEK